MPSAALRLEESRRETQRRLIARGGLHEFLRQSWPHIIPAPFVDGKHIGEVCHHLEAVSRGECRRLVINQPPGTSKSIAVSVVWPIWDWLTRPDRRFMFASFDESLAFRDSTMSRNLFTSTWFRQLYGDLCGHGPGCRHPNVTHSRTVKSADASDTMRVWYNSHGGFRYSTTPESGALGWHAHIQVSDDPTKPQAVLAGGKDSQNALQRTMTWWSGTMATRRADPNDFSRVVIMQRIHENDLAGEMLREGGWTHLNLPMEFVPETACVTRWGGDWRTEAGELLCPERFSRAVVEQMKTREMGPYIYSAQCQQMPIPPGGGIIQQIWLIEEEFTIEKLREAGALFIQSWDCAFKGLADSDFVVGQLWAWLPGLDQFYLCDEVRDQLDFPSTLKAIEAFSLAHPYSTSTILVEDKANGPAVISVLKDKFPGMTPVTPLGSKEARVHACTPLFASLRVRVMRGARWLENWRLELTRFPRWRYDDCVDATTQALLHLNQGDKGWNYWMSRLLLKAA